MAIRAFTIELATVVLAALLTVCSLLVGPASGGPVEAAVTPRGPAAVAGVDDDDTTRPTVNEFYPEERPLSECLSSLPKPDCGSEARGGWAQTTVFAAIIAGLAFIAWRVVAGSRRTRREPAPQVTAGTPGPTTVPDGDGGGPPP